MIPQTAITEWGEFVSWREIVKLTLIDRLQG